MKVSDYIFIMSFDIVIYAKILISNNYRVSDVSEKNQMNTLLTIMLTRNMKARMFFVNRLLLRITGKSENTTVLHFLLKIIFDSSVLF